MDGSRPLAAGDGRQIGDTGAAGVLRNRPVELLTLPISWHDIGLLAATSDEYRAELLGFEQLEEDDDGD